jgi:predicted nucleotidyltransferase
VTDVVERILRDGWPGLVAVYLFGSRARGDATAGSDYDLAVLGQRPIDALLRWELQGKLAVALHAEVDLVDLRAASTVLRAQIVGTGVAVCVTDPGEQSRFEMTALAAYARLNEERAGIVRDAQERGTIHG